MLQARRNARLEWQVQGDSGKARPVSDDGTGPRPRRQRVEAVPVRDRARSLHRAWARARRRPRRREVRGTRVDRRAARPLDAARPLRDSTPRHSEAARTEGARRLQALCHRRRARRELHRGHDVSSGVAQVAGAVGALGLALLIVSTRRELRIAGLVAWALGCAGLAIYLAPHGHHRVLAAAAVFGAVAAIGGAWVVLRVPRLLALLTLACVPARIPVHVGTTQANLLLPLYAVVAVAAIALAWELFGNGNGGRELGPLSLPVAAFVAWDGISLLWTNDVRQGAIELLFFVLPFGLLALVLARLVWSRAWVLTLYVQLAVMALVFAVIGIVQYETRNIFWNPKVKVDNAYAPSGWFYRVNSVFYDPSIYGRFLVVAILASVAVLIWRRIDPLWAVAAALVIAITWAGLLASFSQSSFVALMAGGTLCAVLVWRWRSLALVAVAAVALVFAGVASPQIRHRIEGKSSSSLASATGGRSTLVSKGGKVAVQHPLIGVGV